MDKNLQRDGKDVTSPETTPVSVGDDTDPTPHDAIGASLLNESLTRARGWHQPYCISEEPKREYYVSNLAPTHGADLDETEDEEFVSQIKPSAITLDCRPTYETTLEPVELSFEVYYPSHPTYEEYRELLVRSQRAAALNHEAATGEDADAVDVDDLDKTAFYRLDEDFYRRVDVRIEDKIDLSDPHGESERLTERIREATEEALMAAADTDNGGVKATRDTAAPADWEDKDLNLHDLSKEEFETVVGTFNELPVKTNQWAVSFEVEVRETEASLRLMNEPVTSAEDGEGADESHIFNPKIAVEGTFDRYEFNLGPDDYRFEQFIWAKGHNCSTAVEVLDDDNNPNRRIATTATPSSPVYEFEFSDEYDTRFEALAGDVPGKSTIDVLEDISEGMDEFLGEWRGSRKSEFKREYGEESEEFAEFIAAADNFEEESDRFKAGIEVLRNEDDVRRAFQMMNRVNNTVHNVKADAFDAWRLFQLVFVVSNLPSIVTRDPDPRFDAYESQYDDMAEVLWFPTGGGKTEAYLGLVLFNLFFDRMRGKSRGVTAWIRFPLRLLSRQQKQRFMEAMLEADELRRAPKDEGGLDGRGREFSLGYFVGSQDSPNDIGKNNRLHEDFRASHETLEDKCKHLEECPLCGSDVRVEYEENENTVYHTCSGSDLNNGEECIDRIPIYVTDHDIYRYQPSVLLGSLDKIAVMGMQPLFANLLGNFTTQCPDHGIGYSGRCPEKHICDYDDDSEEFIDMEPGTRDPDQREDAEFFDPVPTLHLVDEVHLLNEELGAFASHYETMYLTLCERLYGVTPKVLTSTATVAEYERQIRNLFQMEATRFPEEGPELGETFYGELSETEVEREYHGLTPNNRTHLYAVLDLIKQYHEVIREYYEDKPAEVARGAGLDPDDYDDIGETVADVLDAYETSLVYFTNKREKDTYRKNIQKQINDEMRDEGYAPPLEAQQLTADTRNDEILPRLEREGEFAADPFEERIDTVPATSFVGHGIDVDRFNFMLFFGYPSQTFQYIQASSRVGRQEGVPGHVLDVFRPFDKRDRHRYKYFEKLHEYLSRTVEPVPIDRWAKFAFEKTFPGILMAILIQYYRPMMFRGTDEDGEPMTIKARGKTKRVNVQNADHLYEMINNDARFPELTKDTIAEFLTDAYVLGDKPTYLSYMPIDADGNPGFYTNEYLREKILTGRGDEPSRLDGIWRHWMDKLDTGMSTPEFPGDEGPMISLRDIGQSAKITNHPGHGDFIEALTRSS
ncbi:DEAD/DEAH box helicase family protein [Halorubrum ezzemoulense]|uniref:DEAD/DEAH box helicase family protein n=1 Tax=Halorubrum ezzemoulense TaxID=337243 RepID=UPI001C52833F|nr:DEAD/DEAH box helicase family protein [Halorubrum ezzemoulense]